MSGRSPGYYISIAGAVHGYVGSKKYLIVRGYNSNWNDIRFF